MAIRTAKASDINEIIQLLDQLGYEGTADFMEEKLLQLIHHPDEELIVWEENKLVVALMSIHFIPQLALQGDFARISYFSVDVSVRSIGIGKLLEEYCTGLAKDRNCDRIEVHCHERRTNAHRFYFRQGYQEVPKYLVKSLRTLPANRNAINPH
jgi:N-acetylglutamate synthase-like GNAT family acetyltransferase